MHHGAAVNRGRRQASRGAWGRTAGSSRTQQGSPPAAHGCLRGAHDAPCAPRPRVPIFFKAQRMDAMRISPPNPPLPHLLDAARTAHSCFRERGPWSARSWPRTAARGPSTLSYSPLRGARGAPIVSPMPPPATQSQSPRTWAAMKNNSFEDALISCRLRIPYKNTIQEANNKCLSSPWAVGLLEE